MSPRPGPLRVGGGVGVGAGGVGAGRALVASCTATAPAAPTAAAAAAFRYVCADCSLARLAVASRKNAELGVCVGATAGGAEGLEGLDEEDEPKLPKLELDDLVDSDLLGEEYEGEREGAGAEYDELLASTMGAATSANAASIKAPATCDLFLQKVFMKVLDLNVRMISRTLDQRKEVILKK